MSVMLQQISQLGLGLQQSDSVFILLAIHLKMLNWTLDNWQNLNKKLKNIEG